MTVQEDLYQSANQTWIRTRSGRFDIQNPTFDLDDIAHALGMTVRFGGHVAEFYSVAEHSVLVSRIMEHLSMGDPLEGLLHDAAEAYLSDVPAPFKQLLPDWRQTEQFLECALREDFGLPPEKSRGCNYADVAALFIEAYDLVEGQGADFLDPERFRPVALQLGRAMGGVQCLSPRAARNAFMTRYHELRNREIRPECIY